MNRFWIILTIVVVALVGLFIVTKPEGNNTEFTGDASQVQPEDHIRGNKDAKVTLIEYGDFQCPSCGAAYPILKEIEEDYSKTVRFVFRNFPLSTIHPNALAASRAAEAAGKQGKFWEMHDKLFETQSLWGQLTSNQQATFEDYAQDLGLDMTKFKSDYVSEEVADLINQDIASGQQLEVQGTPTFLLNGKKIQNPRDKAGYEALLNEALKNADQQ